MDTTPKEKVVVQSTERKVDEWGALYVGKYLVEYPKDAKPEMVKADDDAQPKMDDAEPEDRGPTVDIPTDEDESSADQTEKEGKTKKQQVKWEDLPQPMRVIWPGTRVTRDLRPNRLNIMCDADDLITRVQFF